MTNKQENRLNMYLSFRDYQSAYSEITSSLPNYTTNLNLFKDTIVQIQAVASQQKASTKGIVENKNNLKEVLIDLTMDNIRKLMAFAKFTNNTILLQEINFSESRIRKAADAAVIDYAQLAYDRSENYLTDLKEYNITAETQEELTAAMDDYNQAIGKPGANRTSSKQVTQQLEDLFESADSILDNMDAAVEIVRSSQPTFYAGYKNARKVIENGTKSLAVKGLITDSKSGEPLKGATVSFFLNSLGNSARKMANQPDVLIKTTAEKGGFNVKSLPTGMYDVVIQKVGYADHAATIAVSNGELMELNIQLSKN